MTKSDPPTHWTPKGRTLFPTLYIWCFLYLWRMTLSDAPTRWRPKAKVTHPLSIVWSLYLWRMTLSDAHTHWWLKEKSLPHFHLCDPCTCRGWPCLMLLPTGGRREGHSNIFTWVSLYLWRMTLPTGGLRPRSLPHFHLCDPCTCWVWAGLMSYPMEAEGKVTSPVSHVWSLYL